jgi:hypothetical protein
MDTRKISDEIEKFTISAELAVTVPEVRFVAGRALAEVSRCWGNE